MNKFTLGVVAGVSSLAIAVPVLAQVSFAQSSSSATEVAARPVPTQACLLSMAKLEASHLAGFDERIAAEKKSIQARIDALSAAAKITDDTERQAAMQKAHEAMRSAKEDKVIPAAVQTAMDEVKANCAGTMMMHGGPGMKGGMHFKKFGGPGKGKMMHFESPEADPASATIEQ